MTLGESASHSRRDVTLDNWQIAPQIYWSFQHIEDLFPTAVIARGTGPVGALVDAPERVGEVPVEHLDGTVSTVAEIMAATDTDGWIVTKHGRVLAEQIRWA